MNNDPFFQFGARVGAAMLGIDHSGLNHMLGSEKVMASAEAAPFNRELCKIAAAALAVDGDNHTPAAILFNNLSQVEEWHPGYNRFSDCVKRAMAKQAMLPAVVAANELGGKGLLKTLVATGVIGGAGIGSLGFLLSRHANQTSAENAGLLEKVRAYRQLKRDIEEDMQSDERLNLK
jgi:hypothetical protein